MSAEFAPIVSITPEPSTDDLVEERVALKADVEFIQDRINQIDALLLDRLPVGSHTVAGTNVQVREYSRTDTDKLAADYPAETYPQLYKTTTAISTDAVKSEFAPAVLDGYKVTGKKSVVIK